jgi:hypothetical protein
MNETPENYPGMTRYREENKVIPYSNMDINNNSNSKIILLATATITLDNLFMNGLFQNIYLFYRMFEAMNMTPIFLINKKPDSLDKIADYMKNIRILSVDESIKTPIPVKYYIEIGMSMDINYRNYMKMLGAKIIKLYLGNILNIDIETPVFMPSFYFAHHVIGGLDEIWTSPHYHQHSEYARILNHIPLKKEGVIEVPYIWDPQILLNDGERRYNWKKAEKDEDDVFLILEPNISFQKCSLIPLMIIEKWFEKNRDWKGKVVVINGERLNMIPFFRETILPSLEIVKAGRVELKERMDILSLLQKYPSAIPVCHQWNNEYNYMVLEYFWAGFPVLHNASDWSPYGYYYKNSSISDGVKRIEEIRKNHMKLAEVYKSHARVLTWRHSPYNPEVQKKWAECLRLDA